MLPTIRDALTRAVSRSCILPVDKYVALKLTSVTPKLLITDINESRELQYSS